MSSEGVCISHDDYDGESASLYREGFSRARKPYFCVECGTAIATGVRYQWAKGKSEGVMFRARTCGVCAEIRTAFVCGSWVFGQLWESIRDRMFPVWRRASAVDCLAKLTTDAAIAMCNAEYAEWIGDELEAS